MTESDWRSGFARSLAVLIEEGDSADQTERLYLMLNATDHAMDFVLPKGDWQLILSAGQSTIEKDVVKLEDFSMALASHGLSN